METANTQQDLNNMTHKEREQHKPEHPESIFAEKDNHVTTTSCEIVERLCGPSKQDIVRTGVRADNSTWIMVADGHGYDKVTDALRAQNWDEIMNLDDHFAFIENMIKELGDTSGSGATMSTVIIAKDGMHCRWRGDSIIKIFENDFKVFSATPHNMTHPQEAARIQRFVVDAKSLSLLVLSPTELTMQQSNYFIIGTKKNNLGQEVPDHIAMTNALGHNGCIHGSKVEYTFIPKTVGAQMSVVVASDGFWDMMCDDDTELIATSSAEKLADIADARWGQEWDYIYPNPRVYNGTKYKFSTSKQTMGVDQKDDIGIAVWRGTYH